MWGAANKIAQIDAVADAESLSLVPFTAAVVVSASVAAAVAAAVTAAVAPAVPAAVPAAVVPP